MRAMVAVVCLLLALTGSASASVVNLSPSGTAGGTQIPAGNTQGAPANVIDNDPDGTYYGNTANSATGNYYVTWATAKSLRTIRWMTSGADTSRKVSDFTVLQLTGTDPTNPSDWTPIPGCSVSGSSALAVRFDLTNAVVTKGIKLDYVNVYRPLTGEFEAYDQPMIPVATTMSAINQQYGAPADAADGSPFSSWGSASLANGPGWLEADLGQTRNIGGIRLRFRVQGTYYDAPQNWELQRWDSGMSQWVAVVTQTGWPSGSFLMETNLPGFKTTKMRLYASVPRTTTNFPQGSLGVKELELLTVPPPSGTLVLLH